MATGMVKKAERREDWDGTIIITLYVHNNEDARSLPTQLAGTTSLLCTYKQCDYCNPIKILSFLFTPSLYEAILNLQGF